MRIGDWLAGHGGIALREDAKCAGFRAADLSAAEVRAVGRRWIVLDSAPADFVAAAADRTVVACISAAEHRGLGVLHRSNALHLWARPTAHLTARSDVHRHRSRAMIPPIRGALLESVPDMLSHVADCLPHVEALVIWESALRKQLVSKAELRRYRWPHLAARRIVKVADDRSDSLLETLTADLLRHAGIGFRQQVKLLGHDVDLLVGDRLVVQLDGFEFHTGEQRRRDLEHDARLQLAGYTVLRFAYQDVVGRPDHVLEMIRRHLVLLIG